MINGEQSLIPHRGANGERLAETQVSFSRLAHGLEAGIRVEEDQALRVRVGE
jgi:hypothetical protein